MPDQDALTAAVKRLANTHARSSGRLLSDMIPTPFNGLLLYPYYNPGAILVAQRKITPADEISRSIHICVVHVIHKDQEYFYRARDNRDLLHQCLSFIALSDVLINEHLRKARCTHLFPGAYSEEKRTNG